MAEQVFDFEVRGADVVIKNLDRLNGKAINLSPAFAQISGSMLKSHQINFSQQGSRFGARWQARQRSYPWAILKKTGKLSKSFKATNTSSSATVTNTADYAKYHQFGTSRLPVRNLIGLAGSGGKVDVDDAIRILRKHLEI